MRIFYGHVSVPDGVKDEPTSESVRQLLNKRTHRSNAFNEITKQRGTVKCQLLIPE